MTGLLVKDVDGVRRIFFNRPEMPNAITYEDLIEVRRLMKRTKKYSERR